MRLSCWKVIKLTFFFSMLLCFIYVLIRTASSSPFEYLQWRPDIHHTLQQTFYNFRNSVSTSDMDKLYNKTIGGQSACHGLHFPRYLVQESSWQPVNNLKTMFVFAAYFVKINNELVIIGVKSGHLRKYICQFWFHSEGNTTMLNVSGVVSPMSEGHGMRFTGTFITCAVPPTSRIPTHVSIAAAYCELPQNMLKVQSTDKRNETRRKFTVCLAPLNFQYDRDYELIEWIELNRILGADKFVIYNYSSTGKIEHVLEYYKGKGITEIIQWNIPIQVNTWPKKNDSVEIHYFGQVAALNDCLYRNKNISEFIVNLDLDEFIIPHENRSTTWSEMLNALKGRVDVYLFRNTFFKKEWDNAGVKITNEPLVAKLKLVTLQKLQHERKVSLPGQRSKYIAKTDNVRELMIHEVPRVARLNVPEKIALLHHYRNWDTTNDPPHIKVLDKTVQEKYGERLIRNVQKVWSDLKIE